jgi:hypothetical protein
LPAQTHDCARGLCRLSWLRARVVSRKFVAFVLRYLVCREFPKSRSFGSAEVRFAQDDRSFFDINIGDGTLERISVGVFAGLEGVVDSHPLCKITHKGCGTQSKGWGTRRFVRVWRPARQPLLRAALQNSLLADGLLPPALTPDIYPCYLRPSWRIP